MHTEEVVEERQEKKYGEGVISSTALQTFSEMDFLYLRPCIHELHTLHTKMSDYGKKERAKDMVSNNICNSQVFDLSKGFMQRPATGILESGLSKDIGKNTG